MVSYAPPLQPLFKWKEYCGRPAVDYQLMDGIKYWLCAEHWDMANEDREHTCINGYGVVSDLVR
jgi:hypothetical protein